MACLNPFLLRDLGEIISVPCGRCLNCRIANAYQWSKRIALEVEEHKENCFITLTYEKPEPAYNIRHIQLFFKRLRKRIDKKIMYYLVGELGSKTRRVHYHAIIFGYRPDDLVLYKTRPHNLYISKLMTDTWQHGHVVIGDVNDKTINYCTGYITKDFGSMDVNPMTGELLKPFMTCSKRPAIGRAYFDRLDQSTINERDYIYFKGSKDLLPKYFNRLITDRLDEKQHKIRKLRKYKLVSITNNNLIAALGSEQKLNSYRLKKATSIYELKKQKTL